MTSATVPPSNEQRADQRLLRAAPRLRFPHVKPLALLCLLTLAIALGGIGLLSRDAEAPREMVRAAEAKPAPAKRAKPQRQTLPLGLHAARLARRWLGVGYSSRGASPASGFDCSGFTSYVYSRLGVDLPHNAAAQFSTGRPVPRSRLRPGDLLFFRGLGHVGMYVGRGRMIHSPQSGDVVRIARLGVDYGGVLVGARRITKAQTTHN